MYSLESNHSTEVIKIITIDDYIYFHMHWMQLKAHCFTQSRIDLILDTLFSKCKKRESRLATYCQSSINFLSPCECLVTGYFMFATFHLQPHYYTSCLVWNCGVFYNYAECHYQGERQGLVCVNVAGVNDIGNASPFSIGTVRNSGKN